MIHLEQGPEPEVLSANSEAWGNEYAAALASGDSNPPDRYRRDDIKDALRAETHSKCAYCESHIEDVAYPHIEHIIPKSKEPLLVCSWVNLTLACPKCNTNKGTYYNVEIPLLNPYLDDPKDELTFYGPMVLDRTDRAKFTVSKLQLNRTELLFSRKVSLESILQILRLWEAAGDNEYLKSALEQDLKNFLSKDSEYTNCASCFVTAMISDLGLPIDLDG